MGTDQPQRMQRKHPPKMRKKERSTPRRPVDRGPGNVSDDTIRPRLSMILDPFGEVFAECWAEGDDVVVALLTGYQLAQSSRRTISERAGRICKANSPIRRHRGTDPPRT